jgi:8-oxo-dGTP pyrophosphatase MutT (NUDIX family)
MLLYKSLTMFSIPRTVARACIVQSDPFAVLLARSALPGDAGFYSLPGGGVSRHESPKDALFRELEEELSITGSSITRAAAAFAHPLQYHQRFLGMPFLHTAYVYTVSVRADTTISPNWEITDVYWAQATEVLQLLHPRYRPLVPPDYTAPHLL